MLVDIKLCTGVGGGGGGDVPPKFGENIFGQLSCKIRAFGGKNRVKFQNFVNCLGKYHKIPVF